MKIIIIFITSFCFLFANSNIKKEQNQLKGRKLWISYDNALVAELETHFKKIENGEYDEKTVKEILKIADQYFQLRSVKDKKRISNLIKNLKKIK